MLGLLSLVIEHVFFQRLWRSSDWTVVLWSAGSEDMEKFKSTNDDVDVIVNEYGDDEDLDEEEEEDEEELYVV